MSWDYIRLQKQLRRKCVLQPQANADVEQEFKKEPETFPSLNNPTVSSNSIVKLHHSPVPVRLIYHCININIESIGFLSRT